MLRFDGSELIQSCCSSFDLSISSSSVALLGLLGRCDEKMRCMIDDGLVKFDEFIKAPNVIAPAGRV